jgi:glutamate carboxypeptidase
VGLSELERVVCADVASKSDALLEQIAVHVAIPTGRGHRPGLEQYSALLRSALVELGAEVEEKAPQQAPSWLRLPLATEVESVPVIIARTPKGGTGPRVLIAGHMDTVHDPRGAFNRLQFDPAGSLARGPGAADMKGGIVMTLVVLRALRNARVPLRWTVLLNGDEEGGSLGSMEIIKAVAGEHDLGIAVEPALPDGALAVERMGSAQFKIEAFGRAAHVGREFSRGVSAVTALARAMVEVASLAAPEHGRITNVGPLLGGDVVNAVPAYAACWGNMRYANVEAGRSLATALAGLAREGDLPRIVVHQLVNRPVKPLTPEVRRLAEQARVAAQDLGFELPFARTGGVCDGNLMQAAGLPTLDTLGVCGGNLHRDDEFIDCGRLVQRAQLLAVLLIRLARGEHR